MKYSNIDYMHASVAFQRGFKIGRKGSDLLFCLGCQTQQLLIEDYLANDWYIVGDPSNWNTSYGEYYDISSSK